MAAVPTLLVWHFCKGIMLSHDSQNWQHLNVRGLMILMSWHVLICLWKQEKKTGLENCRLWNEQLIRPFFFYHRGSFQEEETQQTLQVKPLLSAFDDSNCIMRLSWSMAEFPTWKITGLAWARQNNVMSEVFVVVHLFSSSNINNSAMA